MRREKENTVSLEDELNVQIGQAVSRHKVNYITAYALILIAVAASGGTTILVAAGAPWPKELLAAIAALPGFIVLILNTMPFDARADWWSTKQRRLEALRRSLLFESQAPEAVSKTMTQFIDTHNEVWPKAHFVLHQKG
jgi:hypothetical protein